MEVATLEEAREVENEVGDDAEIIIERGPLWFDNCLTDVVQWLRKGSGLSLAAKGLLASIYAMPPGRDPETDEVCDTNADNVGTIIAALRELEKAELINSESVTETVADLLEKA